MCRYASQATQTPDKVIPMCRYASQATQKWYTSSLNLFRLQLKIKCYFSQVIHNCRCVIDLFPLRYAIFNCDISFTIHNGKVLCTPFFLSTVSCCFVLVCCLKALLQSFAYIVTDRKCPSVWVLRFPCDIPRKSKKKCILSFSLISMIIIRLGMQVSVTQGTVQYICRHW